MRRTIRKYAHETVPSRPNCRPDVHGSLTLSASGRVRHRHQTKTQNFKCRDRVVHHRISVCFIECLLCSVADTSNHSEYHRISEQHTDTRRQPDHNTYSNHTSSYRIIFPKYHRIAYAHLCMLGAYSKTYSSAHWRKHNERDRRRRRQTLDTQGGNGSASCPSFESDIVLRTFVATDATQHLD